MIRPAVTGDAAAVRDVVHAAYAHYVARIGKPPGPMLAKSHFAHSGAIY